MGVGLPAVPEAVGDDLLSAAGAPNLARTHVFRTTPKPGFFGIRRGRWKVIADRHGKVRELFDLEVERVDGRRGPCLVAAGDQGHRLVDVLDDAADRYQRRLVVLEKQDDVFARDVGGRGLPQFRQSRPPDRWPRARAQPP